MSTKRFVYPVLVDRHAAEQVAEDHANKYGRTYCIVPEWALSGGNGWAVLPCDAAVVPRTSNLATFAKTYAATGSTTAAKAAIGGGK